jgi:hypothetical protein
LYQHSASTLAQMPAISHSRARVFPAPAIRFASQKFTAIEATGRTTNSGFHHV